MARPVEGPSMVLAALALVADTPGVTGSLEVALDRLRETLGATGVAFYVEEPGGGLLARCRRPPARSAPPGEVLVPARIGGQPAGAIGLGLAPGARLGDEERGAVEGVARALALAVRNDDLVRGLGDRMRALDRQAVHLEGLTRLARGVARAVDEDDVRRVVASEARALVGADAAAIMVRDGAGALVAAVVDGPLGDGADVADLGEVAVREGLARRDRAAAVRVPAGEPTGDDPAAVIVVARSAGSRFTDGELELLRGLADQAAVAVANGRLLAGLRAEQARRRSLAAAIVLAQEAERRRVAEDLHDGPVQELVGVGLMLDALADGLAAGPAEVVADVNRAAAAAREAVRGLRRAIADLHPMALEELGFAAAVRALAERIEGRGARVELDLAAADLLSATDRTLAFRIVQEAVANIVAHAAPRLVTITAREGEGAVRLEVRDDGAGFDPGEERPGAADGHLGLAAAAERATLAGGTFTVASAPGEGTTVALTLPTRAARPDQAPALPPESRSSASASASPSAKRSSTTT